VDRELIAAASLVMMGVGAYGLLNIRAWYAKRRDAMDARRVAALASLVALLPALIIAGIWLLGIAFSDPVA